MSFPTSYCLLRKPLLMSAPAVFFFEKADTPVLLTTDVISFGIPQLQSRNAMKSANAVTDFWNSYVELFLPYLPALEYCC